MNAVNSIVEAIFDAFLTPFELMGQATSLILVSGIFGVLALLVFKQISWQAGIKATKDKIKGHMIAIRIYQDDLAVVFGSVMKVLLRNFQYLGLNFGPILPLLIPFVFVLAQFVVRYGFAPLPVHEETQIASMLPGRGHMLELRMKPGHGDDLARLEVEVPDHIRALSPLARNARDGIAVMEFVAVGDGDGEFRFLVDGEVVGTKRVAAGDVSPRVMQGERVSSFWSAFLWPAEPTFDSGSPLEVARFTYPDSDLGWLPGGVLSIMVTFLVASMAFGFALLKPLNIQI